MPAKSKAQQKFMAIVRNIQKGSSKGNKDAKDAAKRMKPDDVEDYAKTKHKGLPNKVEQQLREKLRILIRRELGLKTETWGHTESSPGDDIEEAAKRDYKAEYKKFQSSTKMKKYRAELNAYNRKKGTYGNGDKKDASHKGGKIVGFESESKNRGRREKSRLKKKK